jgi:hypothetical protein
MLRGTLAAGRTDLALFTHRLAWPAALLRGPGGPGVVEHALRRAPSAGRQPPDWAHHPSRRTWRTFPLRPPEPPLPAGSRSQERVPVAAPPAARPAFSNCLTACVLYQSGSPLAGPNRAPPAAGHGYGVSGVWQEYGQDPALEAGLEPGEVTVADGEPSHLRMRMAAFLPGRSATRDQRRGLAPISRRHRSPDCSPAGWQPRRAERVQFAVCLRLCLPGTQGIPQLPYRYLARPDGASGHAGREAPAPCRGMPPGG